MYLKQSNKKNVLDDGRKALDGLVLDQSWTITFQKQFGL